MRAAVPGKRPLPKSIDKAEPSGERGVDLRVESVEILAQLGEVTLLCGRYAAGELLLAAGEVGQSAGITLGVEQLPCCFGQLQAERLTFAGGVRRVGSHGVDRPRTGPDQPRRNEHGQHQPGGHPAP